jgi:chromosome segregation ATPase
VRKSVDPALVHALEGHVASLKAELEHRAAEIDTLKAQLAAAEARANEESAKTGQAVAAVEAHNATLKADIEKIEAQLATERGDLASERTRADKAIAAFESLAQRLEAMAEARRPWWRRLAG